MRRISDVPPSYGGNRFIRATHGVRALDDGELAHGAAGGASGGSRYEKRQTETSGPRPDFEYYGNAVSSPESTRAKIDTSPRTEGSANEDRTPYERTSPDGPDRDAPCGEDIDGRDGAEGRAGAEKRFASRGRVLRGRRAPRRREDNKKKDSCLPDRDGILSLSPQDGDLLLLILLAVLAGEDGCADLVAALALLLTVR